jgi:adenine-specific DNA-methyltransferase
VQFNQELRSASKRLDPERRAALGQFMTPVPIANFMASLFQNWPEECRLLDPGAGIGSLTQAFARGYFKRTPRGRLNVTAYEVEAVLLPTLAQTLAQISGSAPPGSFVGTNIVERDFIKEGSFAVGFGSRGFTHTILNPPYKKIRSVPL